MKSKKLLISTSGATAMVDCNQTVSSTDWALLEYLPEHGKMNHVEAIKCLRKCFDEAMFQMETCHNAHGNHKFTRDKLRTDMEFIEAKLPDYTRGNIYDHDYYNCLDVMRERVELECRNPTPFPTLLNLHTFLATYCTRFVQAHRGVDKAAKFMLVDGHKYTKNSQLLLTKQKLLESDLIEKMD